jgi:hypothetical protein
MGRAIKVDEWQGTLLGRNKKNGGNFDTSRGEYTAWGEGVNICVRRVGSQFRVVFRLNYAS